MVSKLKTKAITRDKLAKVFKDHELIKLIENIADDLSKAVPQDMESVEQIANEAQQAAVLAIGAVKAAQGAADRLEKLIEQARIEMLLQPDLRSTVEAQRQRIAELEARIESTRTPDLAGLQRQIDELKTLVIGA